jgi:uncharacterized protein with ParB-like and HNH nuclease domain
MKIRDIPAYISGGNYEIDMPLNYIQRWIDRHEEYGQVVNLDPDFQREHVWNMNQRSKYMEHLFRGGNSGRMILWNQKVQWDPRHIDDEIELVDGKQRITTILMCLNDEVPIFGHAFTEFEDHKTSLGLGGPHLRFNVNNLPARKKVLEWYLQVNDGGTPHTEEELNRVKAMWEKE